MTQTAGSAEPPEGGPLAFDRIAGRDWVRADLDARRDEIIRPVSPAFAEELLAVLARARRQGLTLDTIETEDVLLPTLADEIGKLRALLDTGPGAVVLTGIPVADMDDETAGMAAWAIGNHLGRPMRQGIDTDRRLFTVTNVGAKNTDPTRIGASNRRSPMHSDNGCLEKRAPDYLGLLCVKNAASGGESTLVSAQTLYRTILDERPDLLAHFQRGWHFRPPMLHTWPEGPRTIEKPIFDVADGELNVHYARVMVEPGQEIAGAPLTDAERAAFDWFDALLERDDLVWTYTLTPGDFLITNNLATLHGRLGFRDEEQKTRVLKRIWLRQRHRNLRDDPADLARDPSRYGSQAA